LDIAITAGLVADYRRELSDRWGIRPTLWEEEIDAQLDGTERKEWRKFRRGLDGADERVAKRFYEWLSTPQRIAAIHSFKWAEILASGVWAAGIVDALEPQRTLDLGCNVGYWTFWAARRRSVHGVDRSEAAITFAQSRTQELGGHATFSTQDFAHDLDAGGEFDCVVSLQGLQHEFIRGRYGALENASRQLRTGGHLVLVEGGHPGIDVVPSFDAALHDAGLSALWIADCGGLGFGEQTFRYLCLVAVKDYERKGTMEPFFDQASWERMMDWADAKAARSWDETNSAYYWASGASILRAAT
jgi:SAM-dependent methyltransferase